MTEPLIIDSQVHAYERNHPGRPWSGKLHGPDEVTGDMMVAAMDAVGVDGALLVSPWSVYRYDASYAVQVHADHPTRFGLISPFDPGSADLEAQLDVWAATPGAVGARVMLSAQTTDDPAGPGVDRILAAGAKHDLPVNVFCWDQLDRLGELANRHPNTEIVIDHLGLTQPSAPPPPANPWADLGKVIELAVHDNVSIKISGACTLSHEPFPYPDLWRPLSQIFRAFGFSRCLWGTDWTRALDLLTYEEGVESFRVTDQLSDDERAELMGGSLARIYDWSPGNSEPGGAARGTKALRS